MGNRANTAAAPVAEVAKKSVVATVPAPVAKKSAAATAPTPHHAAVGQPDEKYAPVITPPSASPTKSTRRRWSCCARRPISPSRASPWHCLGVRPDELHPYQGTMAAALERVVCGVEEKRAAAISAVEAQIADTEAEQSSGASALESLAASVAQLEGGVAEKAAELSGATEGAAAERARLAAEEGERKSRQNSHAELLAEKVDFEDVHSELWKVVKAGTLPGKDWREKKKMVDATMKALRGAGMCATLAASLEATLRGELAERGPFAQVALDHGERFFEGHVAGLTERILAAEAGIAEQAQAAAAAGEGLSAAEGVVQEKTEGLQSARDSLDAAKLEHEQAAAAAEACRSKLGGLRDALEKERAGLAATQDLASKFDALKQPAAAPAEAPARGEEEEAPAAPCQADDEAVAAPCQVEGEPAATLCQ